MDAVYGNSEPSFTTEKFWAARFKCDLTVLGDDERSGRSKTATLDNKIVKVHQMVLDNNQIKVGKKAEAMIVSKVCICHKLNQD
ncbi:uncharacterized protein FLJ37770 [Nephila pilipes]|uniref:Uncharacterized protein FLJ37770 n=1 Tax=Nephila pilipes TaxID=299642 RepID=A0A8X6U9F3_NEPPI|nr:uncharacterized protein FLJ37770 [Nephila pilipes]